MRRSDRDRIRALPLFRHMTASHFGQMLRAALLRQFPARSDLIRAGETQGFLHVLMHGAIELHGRYKDRETTIDIVDSVSVVVLAPVLSDDVCLASARTLSPAQVLLIPAETVRYVFCHDPGFARDAVAEIATSNGRLVRALKDQKLRSGAERLANWILETDRRNGYRGRIRLVHEKRTLASHLGMTPENLSRNLARLAAYGISRSGREIIITDRAALRRWARPDPLIDG